MKRCVNCGTELPDNALFCRNCGKKQPEQMKNNQNIEANYNRSVQNRDTNRQNNQNLQNSRPYQVYYVNNTSMGQIPSEYKPISMWGYFGYELLFGIPIAGFIITIVLAFSSGNKNVKNFARSKFCIIILLLILLLLIFAIFSIFGVALSNLDL